MPKTTTQTTKSSTKVRTANSSQSSPAFSPVVISMGCPRSVGPEISLSAAMSRTTPPAVIVGNREVLRQAAKDSGLSVEKVEALASYDPDEGAFRGIRIQETGPELKANARLWGRPSPRDGVAQLLYVEEGFQIAKREGWSLVTAPVSKEVIARSGLGRARKFRGHTEWLEELDGAPHSVMCFASPRLATSLVTTHVPVRQLSKLITPELVCTSTLELVDLLCRTKPRKRPHIAVSSLNPHGGEGKLLGDEEARSILPGILRAQKIVGRRAKIEGPVGAETAYRKAAAGAYDGVVAMYHDQATIPMKLLDFGGAVNITQGLSIVRTSVDHGTAYDIAGRGVADARGMKEAMKWGASLARVKRRIPHDRF